VEGCTDTRPYSIGCTFREPGISSADPAAAFGLYRETKALTGQVDNVILTLSFGLARWLADQIRWA